MADCTVSALPEVEITAFQRALDVAGGQSALARICGCTPANIWQLVNKGRRLPAEYVLAVASATGVPACQLRPDIYPADMISADTSSAEA